MNQLLSHYKQTLTLGIPIAIGQIGVIIQGFADTIMVGQFDTNALAASSFVTNVFNLVTFLIMGYSFGLTPLIGALYGQNKPKEAGATFKNGLVMNMIYGTMLIFIMFVLYFFLDKLGQDKTLLPLIRPYYLVILVSMFFVMIHNALRQFTDGTTDTMAGMFALFTGNVLNIIGNWFLIYGHGPFPEMGLLGAGIATMLSRLYMALFLAAVILFKKRYALYRKGFSCYKVTFQSLCKLNAKSLPVSLQLGLETGSFTFSAIMAGWLGKIPLASYQVVMIISTLGFLFYYSFASSMSIRISNFSGKKDVMQMRNASKAGIILLLLIALAASLVFYFLGSPLIKIFSSDNAVQGASLAVIGPLIFYQFADAVQLGYANALRGTAHVFSMFWIAVISYLIIGLPAGYCMCFLLKWGLTGIFLGLAAGLFCAAFLFYLQFHKVLHKLERKQVQKAV